MKLRNGKKTADQLKANAQPGAAGTQDCGGGGDLRHRSEPIKSKNTGNSSSSSKPHQKSDSHNKNEDGVTVRDSQPLLAIFPEEIWVMILEMITSPIDIESACNASPFFRHLLLDKRVIFLFPKVWNILGAMYHQNKNYGENDSDDDEDVDTDIYCTECGSSRSSQWFSKFLQLRLVCRDWCDAIDNFYNETIPFRDELYIMTYQDMLETTFDFYSDDKDGDLVTQIFLEHFSKSHEGTDRNPFLGRRFSIYNFTTRATRTNQIKMNSLLDLLGNYGKYIWYIHIILNSTQSILADRYSNFREVLLRLPNLKYLDIHEMEFEEADFGCLEYRSQMTQLMRAIRINPMPTITNLQYLIVKDWKAPMFNELICRNNHVSSLRILRNEHWAKIYDPGDTYKKYDLCRKPFPNLKIFETQVFCKNDFQKLKNNVAKWPLEKVVLRCDPDDEENFFKWSKVFTLLEKKWANTLTDLEFEFARKMKNEGEGKGYSVEILPQSFSYSLNLPGLKRLKFWMTNLAAIDFLLPMKDHLETLEVVWNSESEFDRMETYSDSDSSSDSDLLISKKKKDNNIILSIKNKQVIQFVGWADKMHESNIWGMFKKLKSIQVLVGNLDFDGKSYTYNR